MACFNNPIAFLYRWSAFPCGIVCISSHSHLIWK
jgi:hypothetical protein